MKKIILHIVNSNVYSGLENVACDIINNISNEYQCVYVTKNGPIVDILKEKNIEFEIIQKVSIKEIKRVVNKYKPDLIHAHDYTASCICALSNIKTPIISHLHNNNLWIKTLHPYSFLYLYCSRKFKKILTVSESIEKEYIFSKYIKNKIVCISNPVSTDKILKKIDDKTYDKKYDICCVGRITEAKNPFRFLEIINSIKAKNSDIKVIWIGDGELKNSVVRRCEELNLTRNINFVGFKKNPYKYMAQSKLFVLTSKWEGYGLVAFEAITIGLPCVVSNVGGLPKIIDEDCGKLCNSNKEFEDEIYKLLSDDKYYNKKKDAAIKKSKKIDNYDAYFNKMKEIYKSI